MTKVRITVEFEQPGNRDLHDCMKLVLHQMRPPPKWDDPTGTGLLNYVCFDSALSIVEAKLLKAPAHD